MKFPSQGMSARKPLFIDKLLHLTLETASAISEPTHIMSPETKMRNCSDGF
jgi:hypothetical protein